MTHVLERVQVVGRPLDEVFAFFADPQNLARITPPWLRFRVVGFGDTRGPGDPSMRTGLRIHYRVSPLGFPQRWTSEITDWNPPRRFVDEQIRGPYRCWRHKHEFRSLSDGTEIIDRVDYTLPLGAVGRLAHLLVKRRLDAIFDYRERRLRLLMG
jgi:ligand-binding SRPBCC domain-containing protein